MKKRLGKILIWSAGLVLLFGVIAALAAALAVLWLGTDNGRSWIAAQTENYLSSDEYRIELGHIRTLRTDRLVLESAVIADDQGVLGRLEGLEIAFNPSLLLTGHIYIRNLEAQAVMLARLPEQQEKESEDSLPAIPDIPDFPHITVEAFRIGTLTIAEEIAGAQEKLSVAGRLDLPPELMSSSLALQINDVAAGHTLAAMTIDLKEQENFEFDVRVSDRGESLVSRLTGLENIQADIGGSGDLQGWQGEADIRAGTVFQTDSQVHIDAAGKQPVITINGQSRYDGYILDGAIRLTIYPQRRELEGGFEGDIRGPGFTVKGLQAGISAAPPQTFLKNRELYPLDVSLAASAESVLQGDPEGEIAPLSGAVLEAEIVINDQALQIKRGYIQTDLGTVNLAGALDTAQQELALDITAEIPVLDEIIQQAGGSATVQTSLTGTYEPLAFRGPVVVSTRNFSTAWPDVNDILGQAPSAKADIVYDLDRFKIFDGSLTAAQLQDTTFSGDVGLSDQGSLNIATIYQDYNVASRLNREGDIIAFSDLAVEGPAGSVSGNGRVDVSAGKIVTADLVIKPQDNIAVTASLSGAFEKIQAQGKINIGADTPQRFSYQAVLQTAEEISVRLQNFSGRYQSYDISLREPATFIYQDNGVNIPGLSVGLDGGTLTLSGLLGASELQVNAELKNIAPGPALPMEFDGYIDGTMALSGPYENPQGTAQLMLSEFALPGLQEQADRYAGGAIDATYRDNILKATANIEGPAGLEFNGEGQIPLSISPPSVPEGKPINVSFSGDVNLQALSTFMGMDEQRIDGTAAVTARLSGMVNNIVVNANGEIRDGVYENFLTGTYFRNISGTITSDAQRLRIENLQGSDRNGGRFSGNGFVTISDLQNPEYEFIVEAQNLQLINTADLSLLASGQLQSRGDKDQARLDGDIIIDHAEYYIREIISTSALGNYEIIEGPREEGPEEGKLPDIQKKAPDIALDVQVTAPNQIYVRAPDLETEWSADLAVLGTMAEPQLRGGLSLVRGRFQLLDTPVIMQRGTIQFSNPDPANPELDLQGLIEGRTLDARLAISGNAQSPGVSLSSDPSYPEDEILARALFGSSVGDLTPLQALRIAQLMAYLSGRSSGSFDPLGDIRQIIGLDTLNVALDDERGATLSAGKYINDRIYVGVDQGASPGSSAIRSEIKVTDEIEVEAVTGRTGENSVGVNWKHDY